MPSAFGIDIIGQAAGPTATTSTAATAATKTKAVARAKSRYAARLEELDGTAAMGASSAAGSTGSSGAGGSSSKGAKAATAGMVGGLLVSPAEYKAHVSVLMAELEEAWSKEEKVAALKVTVQVRGSLPRDWVTGDGVVDGWVMDGGWWIEGGFATCSKK